MRMRVRPILPMLGAAVLVAACARYETRWPEHCRPGYKWTRPAGFEDLSTPESPMRVRGVVVGAESDRQIPSHASLSLHVAGTLWARTTANDSGVFTFGTISPGIYHLVTRRIGYQERTDTIAVERTMGLELRIPLRAEVADRCFGAGERVRKPWWKF